jgi:glutathione synthase/RimK-type ligase-like ATP-grasp enzyme
VQTIDLGIGWEWEYDADFVLTLDRACHTAGLSSYLIHPHNLWETLEKIRDRTLGFRAFLDRASDNVEGIRVLVGHLKSGGTLIINDPDLLIRANDKATMHLELLANGIHVPYTIILGPDEGGEVQSVPELLHIGVPFIIKPANGGGGRGVILGAQNQVDVVKARKALWGDKILLQEEIQPTRLSGRMAWFRTFMIGESVHLCWWNKETHHYHPVTSTEEFYFGLQELREITQQIKNICELKLFSTEIALSADGRFVAIDYVNDQPDLRPQSRTPDGVPDPVLNGIVTEVTRWVKQAIQVN